MTNQEPNKPQLHLTRPLDRSLESFKTWLLEMTQVLVPDAPDDITDEDWVDAHKRFWEKVDKKSPPQE